MSSWGTRRRNFIITIFLCGLFIIIAVSAYRFFYREPTCFDGIQNQGEAGVDCGGPCALLCSHQVLPPLVKWSRYFEIVPGRYNAVAYIENQNPNAKTENLEYMFTLYDNNNAILAERKGTIDLRPAEIIPVVGSVMNTGVMTPSRMTFVMNDEIVWERAVQRQPLIRLRNEKIFYDNQSPRVSAEVENQGHFTLKNLHLVVILYNKEGNAVGVSSTVIDEILSNQIKNVMFTWPQNFAEEASRFEIFPLYETNF